jgi:hypothetical protein
VQRRAIRNANKSTATPRRRLVLGYQVLSGNDMVSFPWNSCIGGEGRANGASAEIAVAEPHLADGDDDLEPEAATEAIAPDRF